MSTKEKLQKLEQVEQKLQESLHSASYALRELSKNKPSMSAVEFHASKFLEGLETIDAEIGKQIAYLRQGSTTGAQPHEGSSYASKKALDIVNHQLEHVRSKLSELERSKTESDYQKPPEN